MTTKIRYAADGVTVAGMSNHPENDRLEDVVVYIPWDGPQRFAPGEVSTNFRANRPMLVKDVCLSRDNADLMVSWEDGTADCYHNCAVVAHYRSMNEPEAEPSAPAAPCPHTKVEWSDSMQLYCCVACGARGSADDFLVGDANFFQHIQKNEPGQKVATLCADCGAVDTLAVWVDQTLAPSGFILCCCTACKHMQLLNKETKATFLYRHNERTKTLEPITDENEPGQAPGDNNPADAQPKGQEPIGQGEAQGTERDKSPPTRE